MFTLRSFTRATVLHDLFTCLYGLAETHRVQNLINEDIGMKRCYDERKVNSSPNYTRMTLELLAVGC